MTALEIIILDHIESNNGNWTPEEIYTAFPTVPTYQINKALNSLLAREAIEPVAFTDMQALEREG